MKRMIAAFALMFFSTLSVFSLDVRDGLVRIKVEDLNGRVTLYRLAAVKESQYEALVFDTDARTSSLAISIDGRRTKLGDTQEYRISTRRNASGAEVEFASLVAVITQKISFIRSTDSQVSNGFKIVYEVRNLSSRDFKVRIRQIWDTRLGEKSSQHFATDSLSRVEEELLFTRDTDAAFIASPGETSTFMLLLKNVERPDNIVLANWKRLSDSIWYYNTLMRGFSLAPYSINDSAMALFWEDAIVKAGFSRSFTSYFLTGGSGLDFVKQVAQKGFEIVGEKPVVVKNPDVKKQLLLEIEAIRQLLASLDMAIDGVDSVSDDEVGSIFAQLEALETETGKVQ
jgi:hypothetical protein